MGRNRRREPSSPSGSHAKHRHRMGPKGMMDWNTPVPEHIAAMARLDRPELDPKKYKVLLELVESPAEKKKLKLEVRDTFILEPSSASERPLLTDPKHSLLRISRRPPAITSSPSGTLI
jgi:hypothetical protein